MARAAAPYSICHSRLGRFGKDGERRAAPPRPNEAGGIDAKHRPIRAFCSAENPGQHKGFNATEADCRGPANPARSLHDK